MFRQDYLNQLTGQHMPLPLSVFIITKNEADRLPTALSAVKGWADEIIVVDSGSTDNTLEIAASFGAKIDVREWQGYGPQKRYAETLCRNDWLLNIDADEELTPALKAEIEALFKPEPSAPGYVLRIRDMLPGERALSPFAHTNFVLRLYNKQKGRFSESPVHDSVILTEGSPTTLNSPVLHRSYRNWAHVIEKLNSYSTLQAQNMLKKPPKFLCARMVAELPFAFFKDFVLRGYMFRGKRGFINSVLYAFARFARLAKYHELKNRPLTPPQ